ncbi:hypothetical protein NMY22_g18727 [Coprinellus aureogranulatus]|nr:hypothetical protein NMY22_g18727 [Coprinellus aureogranulatus]
MAGCLEGRKGDDAGWDDSRVWGGGHEDLVEELHKAGRCGWEVVVLEYVVRTRVEKSRPTIPPAHHLAYDPSTTHAQQH